MPASFVNGFLPALNHESITVSSTAVGFTAAKIINQPTTNGVADPIRRCVEAFVTVEDQPARYTYDGTTPTTGAAGVGHLLAAGDTLTIQGYEAISKFRIIRSGVTDSALRVTYHFR